MIKTKLILLIFIFLLVNNLAISKTLQGGIEYTVETARIEAFEGIEPKIDVSKHQEYLIDKNFEKHMKDISKVKHTYWNRSLTVFSTGSYCVYIFMSSISYFYDENGSLTHIAYYLGDNYPKKSIKYDINGNLVSVELYVKGDESYIFNLNKKLIGYWIGDNCYNEKGELIKTRNMMFLK